MLTNVFKNVNTSFTRELKCSNCGTRLTLDLKYGVFIRSIGIFIFFLAPDAILRLLIFLMILFVYPLILWKFGTLKKSVIDVRSEELQNDINDKELKLSDRIYICPVCGNKIDRDLNAAINLANYKEA